VLLLLLLALLGVVLLLLVGKRKEIEAGMETREGDPRPNSRGLRRGVDVWSRSGGKSEVLAVEVEAVIKATWTGITIARITTKEVMILMPHLEGVPEIDITIVLLEGATEVAETATEILTEEAEVVEAVEDAAEEPAITTATIAEVTTDLATIATVTTIVTAAGAEVLAEAEAVAEGITILKGPIIDLHTMISMQEIDTITENLRR